MRELSWPASSSPATPYSRVPGGGGGGFPVPPFTYPPYLSQKDSSHINAHSRALTSADSFPPGHTLKGSGVGVEVLKG